MSSFIFNGISSDELDLIITKPIMRPSWSEETNLITIPGKARKVKQRTGVYGDAEFPIYAAIMDATPEKVHKIYQTLNGDGILVISTAPAEYLNVTIQPLTPEPVALFAAELSITVTASPFAYAVNPTVVDLTNAKDFTLVQNNGSIYSEPEIRFKPNGEDVTINVNGAEFIVKFPPEADNNSEIVIDCESPPIAYYIRSDGQKVDCTRYTYNYFPLLHTGDNYVRYSGSVKEMSINVRERWL